VLANLPYQITSPFLVALTRLQPQPLSVHLMLQLEVAEVLRAAPGSENYTPLSLLAAFAFDVRVVQRVPAVSFHPRPDVDSALVSLRPLPAELDLKDLLLFGRTLLLARRQALRRTLPRTLAQLGRPASAEALQRAFQTVQLTGQERAEVLQPAQIKALWRALR
jgi:16S rRNA (adenine1518-N6/adenine1519-N6)-dimethyltransferase